MVHTFAQKMLHSTVQMKSDRSSFMSLDNRARQRGSNALTSSSRHTCPVTVWSGRDSRRNSGIWKVCGRVLFRHSSTMISTYWAHYCTQSVEDSTASLSLHTSYCLMLKQKVTNNQSITGITHQAKLCADYFIFFYTIRSWISLGFALLAWQNRTSEDDTLGLENLSLALVLNYDTEMIEQQINQTWEKSSLAAALSYLI